tara:strand:+ start:1909 stop:2415 length:507 start_codon:yes stop_codon:yes gene_type:complete
MSTLNNEYPVAKATQQLTAKSIKSAVLPKDAKLVFAGFNKSRTLADGTPNDSLRFTHDGDNINIPVREYLKFKTPEGDSMMNNEGDSENISIYNNLTVAGSTGRKDSEGRLVFPSQHYKLASAMFSDAEGTPEYDYTAMLEAGFKEGVQAKIESGAIAPVQDYVVVVG